MAKKKPSVSTADVLKSSRGTWGVVDPRTKVVPDKTKYSRKEKHQKQRVKGNFSANDYN